MPTYQYACTECGAQLEVVQSFSDDSLTTCQECQGRLRKVYSAVGIVFKGSGFYRTDSASSSNGSTPNGNSGGSKDSDKADKASGSESKSTEATTASSGSGGSSGGSDGSAATKVA
ncbi:putative FmdB family regulatory protein [Spinactinospora alkalitolerans]|uniref:Putative FmdB family regulatory protein n=1 Tax=Spinactinospora alkalitolerans TaxID=687207 RepID=A0A852TNH8_9ACTN|nr:FmdB family zinc ribbon protein [Spinactinospora alkalitolerans]NYE45498.1 putative FmdB family regulatory protein [Spinactinospora alkalitolerans]